MGESSNSKDRRLSHFLTTNTKSKEHLKTTHYDKETMGTKRICFNKRKYRYGFCLQISIAVRKRSRKEIPTERLLGDMTYEHSCLVSTFFGNERLMTYLYI